MKKPTPWRDLPDVPVIEENLKDFFVFVAERQHIWYRRFIKRAKPPWTENKWLRDYKFTNVYRELDRGTLWLFKHIIADRDSRRNADDEVIWQRDKIWEIVLYRILNKVETFDEVGVIPYNFYEHEKSGKNLWFKKLKELHKKQSVFTSAHLTLPTFQEGKSKLDTYKEVLDALYEDLPNIHRNINKAEDMGDVWEALQEIPCVGPFIAYEICIDLAYAGIIPFSEDSWVNPGPGCQSGIKLIFPQARNREQYIEKIKWLRWNQEEQFAKYGINMHYFNGKRLTLRNIEHSLCEYSKYWKLCRGAGKARIRFKPQSTNPGLTPQGQLPLEL